MQGYREIGIQTPMAPGRTINQLAGNAEEDQLVTNKEVYLSCCFSERILVCLQGHSSSMYTHKKHPHHRTI